MCRYEPSKDLCLTCTTKPPTDWHMEAGRRSQAPGQQTTPIPSTWRKGGPADQKPQPAPQNQSSHQATECRQTQKIMETSSHESRKPDLSKAKRSSRPRPNAEGYTPQRQCQARPIPPSNKTTLKIRHNKEQHPRQSKNKCCQSTPVTRKKQHRARS